MTCFNETGLWELLCEVATLLDYFKELLCGNCSTIAAWQVLFWWEQLCWASMWGCSAGVARLGCLARLQGGSCSVGLLGGSRSAGLLGWSYLARQLWEGRFGRAALGETHWESCSEKDAMGELLWEERSGRTATLLDFSKELLCNSHFARVLFLQLLCGHRPHFIGRPLWIQILLYRTYFTDANTILWNLLCGYGSHSAIDYGPSSSTKESILLSLLYEFGPTKMGAALHELSMVAMLKLLSRHCWAKFALSRTALLKALYWLYCRAIMWRPFCRLCRSCSMAHAYALWSFSSRLLCGHTLCLGDLHCNHECFSVGLTLLSRLVFGIVSARPFYGVALLGAALCIFCPLHIPLISPYSLKCFYWEDLCMEYQSFKSLLITLWIIYWF